MVTGLAKRLISAPKRLPELPPEAVHRTLRGNLRVATKKAFLLRGYRPQKTFDTESKALMAAKQLVQSYDRFSDQRPDVQWVILGRIKGEGQGFTVFVRSALPLNQAMVKATPIAELRSALDAILRERNQIFKSLARLNEGSGIDDRVWETLRRLNAEKAVLETAFKVKSKEG